MVSVSVGRQMKLSSMRLQGLLPRNNLRSKSGTRLAELPPSPADMKHIKHPTSSLQQSHSSIFFSSNLH